MNNVTLILPNYAPDDEVANRALDFLHSLENSLPAKPTLLVVDNGTEEVSHLRSLLLNRLKQAADFFIHYDQPLGYARAVNIGLAVAETEYVVVLNNDLTLPLKPNLSLGTNYTDKHSWLSALIETYESGGGPGVLSAMDHPCQPILYDDSWYSLWMSDRKTITTVGYLDESLPFRYHDQDYSIRMHKAGFKVQRTGKVVVGHDEATTYKKMNVDEMPEKHRMLQKHGVLTYKVWREMGGRPLGR